jgi:hypothetical protein
MGGQNHQPTRPDITPASAWLSREIGKGIISVQQANNHLEDAIIVSMARLHIEDLVPASVESPVHHLGLSKDALRLSVVILGNIDSGFARLAEIAEKIGYSGNPLATSVRRLELDKLFSGHLILPAINVLAWEELIRRIETDNILPTLEWERSQFLLLSKPTEDLIVSTVECEQIASTQGPAAFANAVENNLVPFRQYYARVFSLWNHHNAMFLYSALIMTELFYRANGYSSLADFDPTISNARVA